MRYFRNILMGWFFLSVVAASAQDLEMREGGAPVTLTLEQTIALASDSSLEAFRSKNLYMASYWEHLAFKAGRLPSLTLNLIPGQ